MIFESSNSNCDLVAQNGRFVRKHGFNFVVFKGMPESLAELSVKSANQSPNGKRNAAIGMPVIITAWMHPEEPRSIQPLSFQSLN